MDEPSRLARLRRLVADAAELPETEREAHLVSACADETLRREARELLAGALRADDFLAPPQLRRTDTPLGVTVLRPGDTLAGFRLVRVLGEGGMGTVFEAEQSTPRRKVAVKVVRAGLAGADALQRFARESECLARLRHPGVAQVYASGVEQGHGAGIPWYAMELVEGARTLTEHARARGLDLRARAELLAEVCDAVHHGHVKGVVHRDLKPANVLVDSAGRPRVIDFGIARALGGDGDELALRAGLTRTGEVLGSFEAMSPEQAAGDSDSVDARSDVWALGVLLYELLVGHPPFPARGRSLASFTRAIREEPPPRPRVSNSAIDSDLELVVLHALEKDPARRYSSAAALREDLLAWRDGRPITARAPSLAYQGRVFVRRHRAAALALVTIVVVSLAAAVISLVASTRARAAEALAARRFADTRGLARSILFELHDSIAHLPGATAPRRELVATALTYLDALEPEAGFERGLLLELAEGRLRLAEILGAPGAASLGDVPGGLREGERALALAERLLALDTTQSEARALRVRVLGVLANLELAAGRPDVALARLVGVVEEADELAATEGARPELRRLASVSRTFQAQALAGSGRGAEALATLRRAEADTRALLLESAEWDQLARDLLILLAKIGELELACGERDGALRALEEALGIAEQRSAARSDDAQARADVAFVLGWLGEARSAADAERAELDLARNVELCRARAALDAADWKARESLSIALEELGKHHLVRGDAQSALVSHEEARALSLELHARDPESPRARRAVAVGDCFVGDCLAELGRIDEARATFERALEALDGLRRDVPAMIEARRDRASVFCEYGDLELAAGEPQAALELYDEFTAEAATLAAHDPTHAWSRRMVAVAASSRARALAALGEDRSLSAPARSEHLHAAIAAFEAALAEQALLEPLGMMLPKDGAAAELIRSDLQACRAAVAELEAGFQPGR